VSPAEVARRALARPGGEAFVRQLCWRDFHHQVTAAFPAIAREDYRPRGNRWGDHAAALARWKAGRTGVPIVDAGMRQLLREGWMPNRARLVAASFLVKDLRVDWRLGAAHFLEHLVDGDIANNSGNWQWVAGTGNDTRPNRRFNPIRQAERFDPDGAYVRRWLPELAALPSNLVHQPWRASAKLRRTVDYPAPIVDDLATSGGRRR
jgi:deoxyribodipyrimidine photo-lyase